MFGRLQARVILFNRLRVFWPKGYQHISLALGKSHQNGDNLKIKCQGKFATLVLIAERSYSAAKIVLPRKKLKNCDLDYFVMTLFLNNSRVVVLPQKAGRVSVSFCFCKNIANTRQEIVNFKLDDNPHRLVIVLITVNSSKCRKTPISPCKICQIDI